MDSVSELDEWPPLAHGPRRVLFVILHFRPLRDDADPAARPELGRASGGDAGRSRCPTLSSRSGRPRTGPIRADGPVEEGHGQLRGELCRPAECLVHGRAAARPSYAAHTLVLFEFANDRMIGLTVEARLRAERDLRRLAGPLQQVRTRLHLVDAEGVADPPRRLPEQGHLRLSAGAHGPAEAVPQGAAAADDRRLATKPRFYNTFTSNCTNELAKIARLDWHYSWVLTGYSPQRLFEMKFIPAQISRARAAP